MTIGIGAVCHNGKYVLLASDKRASYGNKKQYAKAIDPNDHVGKQFDFHPLKIAASVAGRLGVTHDIIGELTVQFTKLIRREEAGKPIYREHVENAIDGARWRQMRRRYNWATRMNYSISLTQLLCGELPHGKLDPVAWDDAKRNVLSLPFLAEIIVVGFLGDEPILFKASGKNDIEGYADPAVCVIGSTGARYAMEHLNHRGQNIGCSLAQTILHFHEAMEIAEEKDEDKYIGTCDGYVVMSSGFEGFGMILHRASPLLGWVSAYKNRTNTSSLKLGVAQKQAEALIVRVPPAPRFDSKMHDALARNKRVFKTSQERRRPKTPPGLA